MDSLLAKRAAWYQMWGSLLVLATSTFPAFALYAFCAPLWYAIVLHGVGWYLLARSISNGGAGARFEPRRGLARVSFVVAALGLAGGIASLPLVFPWHPGYGPTWAFVLISGLFPFVPSVYIPAVLGHAVVFWISAGTLRDPTAYRLVVAGCMSLVGLAVAGFLLNVGTQVEAAFFGLQRFIPGLTAIGYGLIARGWTVPSASGGGPRLPDRPRNQEALERTPTTRRGAPPRQSACRRG